MIAFVKSQTDSIGKINTDSTYIVLYITVGTLFDSLSIWHNNLNITSDRKKRFFAVVSSENFERGSEDQISLPRSNH